jgi:flagellar assembly protein FliH
MDPIIRAMPVGGMPRALARSRATPVAAPPPVAPVHAPVLPPAVVAPPVAPAPSFAEELEKQVALARAELRRDMAAELGRERERLREEARQAAEREREDARREGYACGQEQAAAEARAALRQETGRLSAAVANLGQERANVLAQVEDEVVEIVFCAVTRMIGTALAGREQVAALVDHLMAQARTADGLTLRLHPDDADLLAAHGDGGAFGADVALRADAAVALGGCLIDSPVGRLDLRLETLLDQLRATLLAVRAARAGGPAA